MIALRRWLWPKSLAGKSAAVAVYAFLLLAAVWGVAWASATQRLANAIEEAIHLGYLESWDAHAGPPIPDEDNAAFPMAELGRLLERAYPDRIPTGRSLTEDLSAATAEVLANPDFERLLAECDRRPFYRTRITENELYGDWSLVQLKACHELQYLGEAEFAIAERFIAENRGEEAARRLLRALRIVRKWTANEPHHAGHAFAVIIRANCFEPLHAIVRQGVADSLHDEIEKELALHDRLAQDSCLALNANRPTERGARLGVQCHRYALSRPLALLDDAYSHECINIYVRTANETFFTYQHCAATTHPLRGLPTEWYTAGMEAALTSMRRNFEEATARARCLRIVNALAKKKDWDADFSTLGLPTACLLDPLDGRWLRKMRTPDGPIVYSVGGDLQDDSGLLDQIQPPSDVGYGPAKPLR
jgi:hypothetical protein